MSKFSIPYAPIYIQFIFNKNLIELNGIWILSNSTCMQCYSIFSFEWNLVSTKSIHVFQGMIVINSAHNCKVQVNKNMNKYPQ
jgi:hypothetical protein